MMMVPLATLPMPMASPPIDMTVSLIWNTFIRMIAIRMENGMVKEAISELLKFHIKNIMTRMMRIAPSKMDLSTWLMDFNTRMDWS